MNKIFDELFQHVWSLNDIKSPKLPQQKQIDEAMTVALKVDIHLDNDILRITPCL